MFRCLGILREIQHSPNRESDDALVLKAVLAQLENLGVQTRLVRPDELDAMSLTGRDSFDAVLPMCESYSRLMRLSPIAASRESIWVNPPEAVLNCYRDRMTALLGNRPEIGFPPSEIRPVADGPGRPAAFPAPEGWWIKRGDVHNTCDRDVVRVRFWSEVPDILLDFAEREITRWIVQPHIDGDLVKFYGTGPGRWFTWFYHDPMRARRSPFILEELANRAARAAGALGLEIFGGDAIISPNGRITIIDLNSWPSFALVRSEAAVQISWHLQNRLLARTAQPAGGKP